MAKTNGWYEVKAVRNGGDGNVHHGWVAIGSDGSPFFWYRLHWNDTAPDCCRFTSFEAAERVADAFQAELSKAGISYAYEIHFPIRRDSLGRKRPLKRGDCEIVKSA